MKSTFKLTYVLLVCLVLVFACRMEESIPDIAPEFTIPKEIVKASVMGVIVDQNDDPLENVSVSMEHTSVLSDQNGVFRMKDVEMNSYGTLLQIDKEGYFAVGKFIEPRERQNAFIKIMLMPMELTASFELEDGATITTPEGAQISIPANAVTLASGTSYSGTVNVYARYLNPSSDRLGLEMPGDLRAIDEQNELVQLATFGMIGVELLGTNGEKLQLASDKTASIALPIPGDILSNAPSIISLWHYEEATGYWIEEGQANLNGNKYIGEVKHFSFWNCDAPFPLIQIYGKIVSEATGMPLANKFFKIEVPGLSTTRFGFSDQDGNFSGKVPQGQQLKFLVKEIYGGACPGNVEIHSQFVGPFASDPNISILISVPTANAVYDNITVSGNLKNCDEAAVTNGYLVAEINTNNYEIIFLEEDGSFNHTLTYCANNILQSNLKITGYDSDTGMESATSNVAFTPDDTDLDLGVFEVCTISIDEDFYYQIDGGATITVFASYATINESSITPGVYDLEISGTLGAGSGNPVINIENPVLGTQTASQASLIVNNPNAPIACSPCEELVVTITELGAAGEKIVGSFTGTVTQNSTMHTVSGGFDVLRDN